MKIRMTMENQNTFEKRVIKKGKTKGQARKGFFCYLFCFLRNANQVFFNTDQQIKKQVGHGGNKPQELFIVLAFSKVAQIHKFMVC